MLLCHIVGIRELSSRRLVQSTSWLVRELSSSRVDQSASCLVCKLTSPRDVQSASWRIRELSINRCDTSLMALPNECHCRKRLITWNTGLTSAALHNNADDYYHHSARFLHNIELQSLGEIRVSSFIMCTCYLRADVPLRNYSRYLRSVL